MPLSALQIGKEFGLGGDGEAEPRGTEALLQRRHHEAAEGRLAFWGKRL